jgi:hypothetical protein
MKLLYAGEGIAPVDTFKRLLLVADEVAFMDKPSVKLGMGGTVGLNSPARQLHNEPDAPVTIRVFTPPGGHESTLYYEAIRADLANPAFVKNVLEGLQHSDVFAGRFLLPTGRYSVTRSEGVEHLGSQIRAALLADDRLWQPPPDAELEWPLMFDIESDIGRLNTLKMILTYASIQVSSSHMVAAKEGIAPVTDDPYLSRLLAMRAVAPLPDGTSIMAPFLGIEMTKIVIPDEVLDKLEIPALIAYRKEAAPAYRAWAIDINRAAAEIANVPIVDAAAEVQKIIAKELGPGLIEYRHAMESARDKLFGDLMKRIIGPINVSALSVAYVAQGWPGLLAAIAVGAMPIVVPPLIDFNAARRDAARKHSVSYLIGAAATTL